MKVKSVKYNQIWSSNKIREFILEQSKKQSSLRKLRNKLLGIKFQIEDKFSLTKCKMNEKMYIITFSGRAFGYTKFQWYAAWSVVFLFGVLTGLLF